MYHQKVDAPAKKTCPPHDRRRARPSLKQEEHGKRQDVRQTLEGVREEEEEEARPRLDAEAAAKKDERGGHRLEGERRRRSGARAEPQAQADSERTHLEDEYSKFEPEDGLQGAHGLWLRSSARRRHATLLFASPPVAPGCLKTEARVY